MLDDGYWGYADSWRTSNDVECYCTNLTRWSSIRQRLPNRDVLAVDQDRLGATLKLVGQDGSSYVVARRLANGDIAVAVFNLGDAPADIATSVQDVAAAVGGTPAPAGSYRVSDLWAHTATRTSGPISRSPAAHGSAPLRLAIS